MRTRIEIDIKASRAEVSYDPATGALIRLNSGKPAEQVGSKGYLRVVIGERSYKAHRIAWALHYGEQPPDYIDHANRIHTDNRICNLRAANSAQNLHNCGLYSSNKSGYPGVCRDNVANGRPWKAEIKVYGRKRTLGRFETAEEAGLAYEIASIRYCGKFSPFAGASHAHPIPT